MNKFENECIEKYLHLLAENRLTEVFKELDASLTKIGYSTDLTPYFISSSAHYHRAEKEFRLGTISWDDYNVSNAQIISKIIPLVKDLCALIWDIRLPGYVQHPEFYTVQLRIKEEFESLAREIVALETRAQ